MNKTHRTVWSEARQGYVVTHEKAAARGKPSSVRRAAVEAVAVALLGLAAGQAMATPMCDNNSTPTTGPISTSVPGNCVLNPGDSLEVQSGGTISGGIYGIVAEGAAVGGITNSGTISGTNSGIALTMNTTLSGGITNNHGTISGGTAGILVDATSTISGSANGITIFNGGSVSGGITNAGTISGSGVGVNIDSVSTVSGGITNSGGTISGGWAGVYVRASSVQNGITNGGLIFGATGGGGINIAADGTVTGGIINSGTITSGTGAGIVNYGTISGSTRGIYNNGGTISGTSGIVNYGTISGSSYGIVASNSAITGGITNSGTISGSYSIAVYNGIVSGGLTNSGAIRGGGLGISVNTSTIAGGITNSGTISASGSSGIYVHNSTITGGITNSGTISAGGSGNAIHVGNSTLLGGLTNSGTISSNYSGIYVGSNSTLTGGLTNSGTISGGNGYAIYADGSSVDAIHITGNDSAKFIGDVYAPNTPVTVDALSTYTLNNNNNFTVQSFTNAGTLKVDASAAGTITGTIHGNFTNTGSFRPKVTSMTNYGQLAVTGTATLGGQLYVLAENATGLQAGTLTGVISAGTLSGTFSSYDDDSQLFNFVPVYGAHSVDLKLQAVGGSTTAAVASTGNTVAQGAATVLDRIFVDTSNPIATLFLPVSSQGSTAITNAVTQILPLNGTTGATNNALTSVNQAVQTRMEGNRGISAGDMAYSDEKFWFKPFGSWADQNGRDGVAGYKSRVAGLVLGADAEVSPTTRVGLAFAYAGANVSSKSTVAAQGATVDVFQLIAYGSYRVDERTDLDLQADFGNNKNEGHRNISFVGTTAKSKYDSFTSHLGASLSRSYPLGEATSLIPSVRVDYTNIRDNSYTETGAGVLNLSVNGRTTEELIYAIDGKVNHKLDESSTLLANLGLGYDSMAKAGSITAAFAGAPGLSFTTKGMAPAKDIVRAGFGYVHAPKNGPELTARYDVELREGFKNETLSAKARWAF